MVLQPLYRPSSALQALYGILQHSYLPDKISPELYASVEQALVDLEPQLAPIPAPALVQILTRFFLHYPQKHMPKKYVDELKKYPEDLLCAAYHYLLKRAGEAPPSVEDFIYFMQPEFLRRKAMRARLLWLKEQQGACV